MYDITNRETFGHVESWLHEIGRYTNTESVSKLVIGNKCDIENKRQVPTSDGQDFCFKLSIPFCETSARTNSNVEEAFSMIVSEILQRRYVLLGDFSSFLSFKMWAPLCLTAQCEGGCHDARLIFDV